MQQFTPPVAVQNPKLHVEPAAGQFKLLVQGVLQHPLPQFASMWQPGCLQQPVGFCTQGNGLQRGSLAQTPPTGKSPGSDPHGAGTPSAQSMLQLPLNTKRGGTKSAQSIRYGGGFKSVQPNGTGVGDGDGTGTIGAILAFWSSIASMCCKSTSIAWNF